jgi:hypothetical protein
MGEAESDEEDVGDGFTMEWSRPTDGALRNGGVIDRASLAQLPIFETLAGGGMVSYSATSELPPSRLVAPR